MWAKGADILSRFWWLSCHILCRFHWFRWKTNEEKNQPTVALLHCKWEVFCQLIDQLRELTIDHKKSKKLYQSLQFLLLHLTSCNEQDSWWQWSRSTHVLATHPLLEIIDDKSCGFVVLLTNPYSARTLQQKWKKIYQIREKGYFVRQNFL